MSQLHKEVGGEEQVAAASVSRVLPPCTHYSCKGTNKKKNLNRGNDV